MGDVFRGFHERLKRPVALKRIQGLSRDQDGARRRLVFEAQTAARLNHPSIVQVYDILEHEGDDWIVMELVEGRSLREQLKPAGMPWPQVVEIAVAVTEALAAAHGIGVLHRDLKAENVLLADDGAVKLLDFGLAKDFRRRGNTDISFSSAERVLGTPRSMSPEQARGEPLDPRSDLFSLGILLYECLTGISPFRASTVLATLQRVCVHRPKPVVAHAPGTPRPLSLLVDRLLEKDPVHRPVDARSVLRWLQRIPGTEGPADSTFRLEGLEPAGVSVDIDQPTLDIGEVTPPLDEQETDGGGRLQLQEKRQVTLLCCEMRGVDSEDFFELLPQLRHHLTTLCTPYEGTWLQTQGHRLVVGFGVAVAHEDDAMRAVKVARRWLREIPSAVPQLGSVALCAAIHTGPAIVQPADEGGESSHLGPLLDELIALAQRAQADDVLVGSVTHSLVSAGVSSSPVRDAGKAPVYRITSEEPVLLHERSAPLLGRAQEMHFLLDRWHRVTEGTFQAVQICGEAGIGKSKLVMEFYGASAASDHGLLIHGAEHTSGSPFYCLGQMLRQLFDLSSDGTPEQQTDQILTRLQELNLPKSLLGHLAPVLSLRGDDATISPDPISPKRLRQRTLDAVSSVIWAHADQQPTVMIVEDLHWIDPSTLELLGSLIRSPAEVGLLLLLTLRPQFEPPWGHRPELAQIMLTPLARDQTRRLIRQVSGKHRLSEEVVDHIAERTDGVPLFVEQLTEMLAEQESSSANPELDPIAGATAGPADVSGSGATAGVPEALRGVLAARLDRLGTAKLSAQLASVLGRDFSFDSLEMISPTKGEPLRRALDRLAEAGLIRRRARDRDRYQFKHALIRDAAYDSLLKRDRQVIHRRIADSLRAAMPEWVETHPEIVAWHDAEAGRWLRSVDSWMLAGHLALERFSNIEAARHFRAGLRALAQTAQGPGRDRRELRLQIALAQAAGSIYGFSAPEIESVHLRALELVERVDIERAADTRFQLLWGLWAFRNNRGRFHEAMEIAHRMLGLAETRQTRCMSLEAAAITVHFMGDLKQGIEYFEAARSLFSEPEPRIAHERIGMAASFNNRVSVLGCLGFFYWLAGAVDQGRELARQAVDLGTQLSARDRAHGLFCTLSITYERGEDEETLELATEAYRLCCEHELFFSHQAAFFLGLAEHRNGLSSTEGQRRGLERASRAALTLQEKRHHKIDATRMACYLAAEHLKAGDTASAASKLAHGRKVMEEIGEHFFEAELLRLEAEVLRAEGNDAPAQALLEQAMAVADEQQTLSQELRACLSLSRLLRDSGKPKEAHETLAKVYGRFTEGFETRDLRQAADLLAQLAPGSPTD